MKVNLDGISETLLVPLWARAVETRRPDAIIHDDYAVKLVETLDYDFTKFEPAWLSQVGVAVRTELLDRAVQVFIVKHPQGMIINIGCGLDTRFFRLDNRKIRWYDLDLPEALQIRRQFFSETERYRMIGKSVFDFQWLDEVRPVTNPVLIIAEGILMYFKETEVKTLFERLSGVFPEAEMLLEVMPSTIMKLSKQHDTIGKMGVTFQWGIGRSAELENYAPRLKVTAEWNFFDFHRDRWKWLRWPAF